MRAIITRLLPPLILLAGVLAPLLPALPAMAAQSPGALALDWAEANTADLPYVYGGAGPGGYDCSGLVAAAFAAADRIVLPHNTVAMVQSGRLHRTSSPARGDLAVWGDPSAPYHIEFVTIWPDVTFGAHHTGTAVGYRAYGPGWSPSAFYTVT